MEKYSTDHLFTFKHINNVSNTLFMCLNSLIKQFYSFDRTCFYEPFRTAQASYFFSSKKIGLALINDLELCITARLAFYLDVNPSYDGHEATFIWIEYFYKIILKPNFLKLEAFLQLIPGC